MNQEDNSTVYYANLYQSIRDNMPTFSWTDPDTSNTFNLSYTDEDMLTATKLKAWFELGGGARNWTFSNGVTINVTQAQFLEVITAGIAKVSENL